MIFATFFNVDHDQLLQPKSESNEVVVFDKPIYFSSWKVGPKGAQIQPIGGVVPNVLKMVSLSI